MSDFSPALTSDQWLEYAPWDRTLAHFAPALAADNAHGAAALALHAQPYGFTWDDYDELIDTAHEIERDYGPPEHLLPEPKRQIATLRSLARRIATLLPPRDMQSPPTGG
ncbi:MAG: hypothetical protein KF777_16060 [Planctomycetaceae bacterium]|nr:hypothetical protein [Planctomycetaceae bacterium]